MIIQGEKADGQETDERLVKTMGFKLWHTFRQRCLALDEDSKGSQCQHPDKIAIQLQVWQLGASSSARVATNDPDQDQQRYRIFVFHIATLLTNFHWINHVWRCNDTLEDALSYRAIVSILLL